MQEHRADLATIFRENQDALGFGDVERIARVSMSTQESQIDDFVADLPP